uniref:Phospholipid/glycerol acyltransferase domain-containing protein n=1 Tax=Pyrodinium bahamense TaxID=73915 RepID=A0A7S0B9Z7_9DINO|eukprot:CAMPEP_0179016552 /NCGR_PEP_ID=MMETSP0796-20121207/3379_1 /TAXON_ID=73915 /ORGANISM="Pyrodinium bahamense, Strain pbaha01" /LENGTH=406 /DNA_ID=CAMNT_0020712247 /DNA_START=58 /DNA_END=1278 /DNA_ORIENTATION=-
MSQLQVIGIMGCFMFWQMSLVGSCAVFPLLPLLVIPSQKVRCVFSWWSSNIQASWLASFLVFLRYGLGIKIFFHTRKQECLDDLAKLGNALVVCNHRSRIDWMFLWGLAAAMDRLRGIKIVLKDSLRKAPGAGWVMQCTGFLFMARRSRDSDLSNLESTIAMHCQDAAGGPLAFILFPEGTDLSESNIEKSNAFATARGLPCYTQVLHPKTAGFVTAWQSLRTFQSNQSAQPALVDVTIAYMDHQVGERPSELSVFLKGRPCREVHMFVEPICGLPSGVPSSAVEELCRQLFAKKESRLAKFYAPCASGSLPNMAAFRSGDDAFTVEAPLEAVPAARSAMHWGCAAFGLLEATALFAAWELGTSRTLVAFIAICGVYATLTGMGGGIDQLLLRHVAWRASIPLANT